MGNAGNRGRIFTYWHEPREMPDYIARCMDTWITHAADYEVVLITDASLEQWTGTGVLDLQALSQYPLSQRKDAIEVATLARHGGLFLDADTLMAAPPRPLFNALEQAEVALYGNHLAAVAARPESPLMARWLQIVRQVLAVPRAELEAASSREYFQFGNHSLELLREELASGRPAPVIPGEGKWTARLKKLRRRLVVDTLRRNKLRRIDTARSGYLPEHLHCDLGKLSKRQAYEQFWFDRDMPPSAAIRNGATLIALHHSWTPAWYCALDKEQLDTDQCLLSRTLRHLGPAATPHTSGAA